MRTPFFILLAAAAGAGCQIHYEDPPQIAAASVAITVAPDPLRLLVTCPPGNSNCFGSLDATVALVESAGLGGRVEYVDVSLYNVIAAKNDSQIRLGADWFQAQAGTNRVEAMGRLAVRPVVQGYPFPAGQQPQLEIVFAARFVDDKGNVLEPTKRVPLL